MFNTIKTICRDHINYRKQILFLANVDKDKSFKGSDLGWIWALFRPGMRIAVYYVAMTIGFKAAGNVPNIHCSYFLWLVTGLAPWFYMCDMMTSGATCFIRYRGIIKNTRFPDTVIPTIVTLSNFKIHIIVFICVLLMFPFMGNAPTLYWLEIPFYVAAMLFFTYFWSLATGILSVISKDFLNILRTMTSAMFWLSAILFDLSKIDNKIAIWFFRLNPVTFVSNGYRNALCKDIWFFEEPESLACFAGITVVMILIALGLHSRVGKKLADMV